MKLFSIELLKKEIKELESKAKETELTEHEKIILSVYKRELLVLEKVKLELFDLRGEISEVEERLKDQSIYCMKDSIYADLHMKAHKYDRIAHILSPDYIPITVNVNDNNF